MTRTRIGLPMVVSLNGGGWGGDVDTLCIVLFLDLRVAVYHRSIDCRGTQSTA